MHLFDKLKGLVGLSPTCLPSVETPQEDPALEDAFQKAVHAQAEAHDSHNTLSADAVRSARVSSVITKNLIRRRLDKSSILATADEAVEILEGRADAPPR